LGKLKAILVKPPKKENPREGAIDVQEVVNIGCAIFKEMFRTKKNLKVVDFIMRPYGVWVVIEVPKDVEPVLRLG